MNQETGELTPVRTPTLRVGFAHDLFRGPALGQWDAAPQARWLRRFLTPAIEAAGASVVDALNGVTAEAGRWSAEQVRNGNLPGGADAWPWLYGGTLPDGAEHWFDAMLGYDLLVGYELSANQLRFLSQHHAPVLDLGIDAIRFARQLLFRARSNSPVVLRALKRFHVPAGALAVEVGFLVATLAPDTDGLAENLLIVGQVDTDSSLITGGRISRIGHVLPRLQELADRHAQVIAQPHPLAERNEDMRTVLRGIVRSTLSEGGIYAALADPRTRTVATLSSSVATEAALFGKEVVRLLQPDGSSEALGSSVVSMFFRLDSHLAQPEFWEAALARAQQQRGRHGHDPDGGVLRAALGVFSASGVLPLLLPTLVAGQPALLSDPACHAICRLGWSGPEAAGRWTDGPVAILRFGAAETCAGLVLRFHTFLGPPSRSLGIHMVLFLPDGSVVEQELRSTSEAEREVRMDFIAGPGELTLKLLLDAPCSPAELDISTDTRQLGIQLVSLALLPAGTEER